MRKHFEKLKNVADNLTSRSTAKVDKKSDEIQDAESKVEKYKEVITDLNKKISANVGAGQQQDDEKRRKKIPEFVLSQMMDDSANKLPQIEGSLVFRKILLECSYLQKTVSERMIQYEKQIEESVCLNLNKVNEQHFLAIYKQKRTVNKCVQESQMARQKFETSIRLGDAKATLLKEDLDECDQKLEKERDTYASLMFDLLAEEKDISDYFINYVRCQQAYYRAALADVDNVLQRMDPYLSKNKKKVFKVPLEEHLAHKKLEISSVIELCVCCLVLKGLDEEGLLRVGCASSKLKRLKSAVDANLIAQTISPEYMDVHVIAGLLKLYLRSLPEPLLTYKYYKDFMNAVKYQAEDKRKNAILDIIKQLPKHNYTNLRYLIKFLSELSKKSNRNKMSTQNIAIVMSPNLLWPPVENDDNYQMQVDSTASVNVIVEALIADYDFFFGSNSDVKFFLTLSRDTLLPDTVDVRPRSNILPLIGDTIPQSQSNMSKSMHVSLTGTGGSSSHHHASGEDKTESTSYKTHSRSNSHDASRILFNDNLIDDYNNSGDMKRSQSNSSLSDHSSPQQSSSFSKPTRSKRNKPAAPIPPDTSNQFNNNNNNNNSALLKLSNTDDDETSAPFIANKAYKNKMASSCDDLSKPEKPPRPPQLPFSADTMNRSQKKNNLQLQHSVPLSASPGVDHLASADDHYHHNQQLQAPLTPQTHQKTGDGMFAKPVAKPRKIVPADDVVLMREKPAIPERPATLFRPHSFKGSLTDMSKSNYNNSDNNINSNHAVDSAATAAASGAATTTTSTSTLKKTNSLRNQSNSGTLANCGLTQLERTQIYNIDKQQVSIIDVGEQHNNTNHYQQQQQHNNINNKNEQLSGSSTTNTNANANVAKPAFSLHDNDISHLIDKDYDDVYESDDNQHTVDSHNSLPYDTNNFTQVPPSPRGFDAKIKRPQVPAPPPPTAAGSAVAPGNRPKSIDGAVDSTNL